MRSDRSDLAGLFRLFSKPLNVNLVVGAIGTQGLQSLVRDGILVGVRGPRGGYRLARERRRITVGEIVRVVRPVENEDDPRQDGPTSPLGCQVVRPLWLDLQGEVMLQLDRITLDDLCGRANAAGIVSEGRQAIDFVI